MRGRKLLAVMGVLTPILPVFMATADETSNDGGLANLIAKAPGGEIQSDSAEELLGIGGRVTAMVEFKDDPVVVVKVEKGGKLTTAQEEKIGSELSGVQDEVATTIEARGGAVKGRIQFAFNGIRATIDSSELKNPKSLSKVKAIHSVPTYEHSNAHGVPMIGAPKVWEGAGGAIEYTDEGVKVAVIDIGINYTYAIFGGPGTVEAFNKESTAKTPNSEWFGLNAPRVKGGVGLAGDEYNDTNALAFDDNPIDCAKVEHGTHVAGTVGGVGTLADGKTYAGAYDQKTHENEFKVGPSVAPEAELYTVRVFGCTGSAGMTTEAINRTVKNKTDVINISLGAPYGKRSDADAIASSNIIAAGVVVLAPVGNYGSQPYLTGSPASGAGVTSVAINSPVENYPDAQLTVDDKSVQAMNANDTRLPVDTPVHMLKDVSGNVPLGCADFDYTNVLEGSIVTIVRGNCTRVARAALGQKHKVAVVVIINSSDDYTSYEGKVIGNPSTGEQPDVTIPSLTIRRSDGAALTITNGKQMTFAVNMIPSPDFTKCGDFTSAGLRSDDSAPRPNVAAPGVFITSIRVGFGNDSGTLSGTFMAAPYATGVAALTKQTHPSWNSQEISMAIVSTVDTSKVNDYGPTYGDSLVDPVDSTIIQAFAYGDSNEAKDKTAHDTLLGFDYQESNGSFEATKTITPVNKGNSEVTFNREVRASSQSLPAQVKLNTNKVTVPAGGTADVTVTLTTKISDVPSNPKFQNSQNFYEVSGNVQFTPSDKALSVPCLMVPRFTTKVTGEISSNSSKAGFQNQGGTYDTSGFLFNWGTIDPKGNLLTEAIEAGDDIDIANIGITTTTFDGEKALIFTTNGHTHHSNTAGNSCQIPIDNNNDGKTNYAVFSADSGKRRLKAYSGVPEVFIYDMATKTGVPAGSYTLAPSDSSIALLTVKTSSVGVTGKLQHGVVIYSSNAQVKGAIDGMATYDPENCPFNDGQGFQVPAGGSKDVSVMYNKATTDDQKSLGWMAVIFDNDRGTPEVVAGSLTSGETSPTVSPTTLSPTVTLTNPNPTGSVSPGDPSVPVSPVPTWALLRPGLLKTGDLG